MKKWKGKDGDRHFAFKHAIKCAVKGNVVLTNTLEAKADSLKKLTREEKKMVDNALAIAWKNFI